MERTAVDYRDENGWTRRQIQIVRLLDQGLEYREVANELGLSPNTIKSHLKNISDQQRLRGGRYAILHEARQLGYLVDHEPSSEKLADSVVRRMKRLEEAVEQLELDARELDDYLTWLARKGTVPAKLIAWPAKFLNKINDVKETI